MDERFLLDPFEPAYAGVDFEEKLVAARRELMDCCACPRACHVDRRHDETGICSTGRHARIASVSPHLGEEDCLRGWNGSGTIFLSRCNLRCVFCQNWDISQAAGGEACGPERIADFMLALQGHGCHNINFVTPEHVVPQLVEAIAVAVARGLKLPIVYNTSAYDSVASLRLMEGLVDIYMPDFKFWRRETARRLAKAKDYPEVARSAIAEMARQVGPLRFGPDGLARRGLLVRHLVMPGQLDESAEIFRWLATEISPDTWVNVMGQYRPAHRVGELDRRGEERYAAIHRSPRSDEMKCALDAARAAGLWRLDKPR